MKGYGEVSKMGWWIKNASSPDHVKTTCPPTPPSLPPSYPVPLQGLTTIKTDV